jgi:hypothetical protein
MARVRAHAERHEREREAKRPAGKIIDMRRLWRGEDGDG